MEFRWNSLSLLNRRKALPNRHGSYPKSSLLLWLGLVVRNRTLASDCLAHRCPVGRLHTFFKSVSMSIIEVTTADNSQVVGRIK